MNSNKCSQCQKKVVLKQGIYTKIEGVQVVLCDSCWNKFISESVGLDFKKIELRPITLEDYNGKPHKFHFRTHLVPTGLAIEAHEILDNERNGYEFSVLGSHDCNQSNSRFNFMD